MHLAYRIAKEALPPLNVRPLDEADFEQATSSRGVYVHYEPLELNGFYYQWHTRRSGIEHHIYINTTLARPILLETIWHEYCHFLLHVPHPAFAHKQEVEARLIASIALIPHHHLFEHDLPLRIMTARSVALNLYGI